MAQDIGGNIGQRMVMLAYHAANRNSTISLGIVTKVDLDRIKVDVKLKNTKGDNIIELFACPILSQSYDGGGQINIPRIGDLVVILYSKYNIEKQIKNGGMEVNEIDEINVAEQNYGIVIGTIYPMPTTDATPPRRAIPGEGEPPDLHENPDYPIKPDWEPRFNRPPVYHAGKRNPPEEGGSEDRTQRFIRDRLEPHPDHQIWYHPYDHEIRMTKEEIFIKHKTGTQIICRESGDLEIYVWNRLNVHAQNSIVIESEQSAVMLSYVPHKERPWRATSDIVVGH
jgi:hypothetical protein